MSIYKRATKKKLRIQTSVGMLSIEQLWDLPLEALDTLAVSLEKAYKESGSKSFLNKTKAVKDADLKLTFDIVLDVLETKQKDAAKSMKAADTKAHNQKILGLIAKKKEGEMEEMSVEELEAMLQ